MSDLHTQFRTLLSVARCGSFGRAADELFVTQAAVTSRMKSLEAWLGFRVFARHRRGVHLTRQGERFMEYARNAIDIIEHGREEARRVKAYRVHYRFMCHFLLLEGLSLDWIGWMQDRVPDVSITVESNPSMIAAQAIAGGLLDLAVGYQEGVVRGVEFEVLYNEKLVLVTSFDDVDRWRENFIPIEWDDEFDEAQRQFIGDVQDDYRVRAHFSDAARMMLMRAPASAYVLERTARPLIERGVCRPVENAPAFERPAHAIYPARPTHPDVQSDALEGLRDIAQRFAP